MATYFSNRPSWKAFFFSRYKNSSQVTMKNKESLENFNETAALLKETVQPLCNAFQRLVKYQPKEELIQFLLPIIVLSISARYGYKCWIKTNVFLGCVFGGLMFFYPQALLNITVIFNKKNMNTTSCSSN